MQVTFYSISLLGRSECGKLSSQEGLLVRILMPLIKLYTAKAAVRGISEALEALGGTGYLEDSGMPRLLRDAQVLPIWEGTTNVLSLDVFRVLAKTPEAFNALKECTLQRLPSSERAQKIVDTLEAIEVALADQASVNLFVRDISMSLITCFAAGLLYEAASSETPEEARVPLRVADRYTEVRRPLYYSESVSQTIISFMSPLSSFPFSTTKLSRITKLFGGARSSNEGFLALYGATS